MPIMFEPLRPILESELAEIKSAGLWKPERVIESPQGREITVGGRKLLNFCANNYLGLAGSDLMRSAADAALSEWGYGLSSVRFICGTQQVHKELESATAKFIGAEDAVLYSSCFMANLGLFQTFFGADDAIISDSLNHASVIDGVRLSKAERFVYDHVDMASLEDKLKATAGKRLRVIATDGVFSMDGHIAPLAAIADLADKYKALLMVDDAHSTGFVGPKGRGTADLAGVRGRVDFTTSTYGKALGGAGGAFIATTKSAADMLRQRSRTYLFSNALDTGVTGASLFAINYIQAHPELRERLWFNTARFQEGMKQAGFDIPRTDHPITPIMLGDAKVAQDMAAALLDEGLYVIGFSFPVVPKGTARIRVQISAAHTAQDIDRAIDAFTRVGTRFGAIWKR
jgi:glycine C-acetyltransferase